MYECERRTESRVEEGRGSRLRAGQYAQAGCGGSGGSEMRWEERSYGRPGGEGLAGGAKTCLYQDPWQNLWG